ncbi:hypothetical protein BASA81_001157 [Batrachochytrium salamandrivorans]|nr:hypothetical protein BASA81_001157 [Batrachochytrium salamandrivorans]
MLAVLQLCATADVRANLANALAMVRRAAANDARFICLPEAFDYIVDPQAPTSPQPERIDTGERTWEFKKLAKELGVWISLGGMHEKPVEEDGQGKHYNSHVVINALGDVCAVYRKIHLFDAQVDNGYKESNTTLPGRGELQVVENTPVGTVGLTTCYDVRFPVIFQKLRDLGCDIILVPAAFAMTTGEAGHWHTLLRARAIENQVYIAAAAQVGSNHSSRECFGHSLVVDPFGKVMVDLQRNCNEIGYCPISLPLVHSTRMLMPVQQHRHKAQY